MIRKAKTMPAINLFKNFIKYMIYISKKVRKLTPEL